MPSREASASEAPAALRPLPNPRSLVEDAADVIREQILQGGFRQGEHLVEARIAEQLHVSRGPVREAFKLLRAEGLLAEEPRRGTFVVSLTSEDVRAIYGLRAAVEGRAALLLASERDPDALVELHRLLEGIESAARAGDVSAVFRRDLEFHDGLCRLSGNARIHEVFVRYVPMLRALLRLDERVLASLDQAAMEHRPIVDAIDAGEPDRARRLAEDHCDHAGDLIATYFENQRRVGGDT
jgi:GntR family transcriptional regulator of gluconate operon